MDIKITILAKNANGSIGDANAWAKSLKGQVMNALAQTDGADLDVSKIEIERKLDGYEKIG